MAKKNVFIILILGQVNQSQYQRKQHHVSRGLYNFGQLTLSSTYKHNFKEGIGVLITK